MKEFLNRHVWIHIKIDHLNKYYDAIIKDISETHITFIDKFKPSGARYRSIS